MQSYHDNPFDPNHSQTDLNEYYDHLPPANRAASSPFNNPAPSSQGGFNNIPLSVVPSTSVPYTPVGGYNQAFGAESTDDLPTNNAGINYQNRSPARGFGMAGAGGYTDMARQESDFGGAEPKLGAYAPGSRWMEPRAPKSNRKKWIVIGSIVALAGLVIIGVVVGVVVAKNSKKSSSTLATTTTSSTNSSVVQTDPNDPSSFTQDTNLHKSFYGLAYTPVGSQLPDCGNSLDSVIQDIQIMSQLTSRVRLYGADCNQSALVLEAITQTKVNMTVWLGNYPVATDNGTAYERQRDLIKAAIQTYGTDHIGGITVGNEFMLNYVTQNGITDVNSAAANTGAAILLANIQDTQSMLTTLGVSIPVGNADAGSYFNDEILAAVNYGMANVHPWFANVSVETAAAWTATFFAQQDVALAATLSNNPTMYIAETGWPSNSSDVSNESNGPSTASSANLQIFLDTFVCAANTNGTGYFFFEFCDEEWKDVEYGGVEGWWGLFNQDRSLKNITIPTCTLS